MRDVDKPENTTRVNPVGTGVAFPTTDLKVGDNMYWRNWNGGNEYILYYHGKQIQKQREISEIRHLQVTR